VFIEPLVAAVTQDLAVAQMLVMQLHVPAVAHLVGDAERSAEQIARPKQHVLLKKARRLRRAVGELVVEFAIVHDDAKARCESPARRYVELTRKAGTRV